MGITINDVIHIAIACVITPIVVFCNAWSSLLLLVFRRRAEHSPSQCVVVITGCDTGFGYMTSIKLAGLGYVVVSGCLTDEGIARLKDVVATVVKLNVTSESDIKELVAATDKTCMARNAKLWAVINNAGIGPAGCLDWTPVSLYRQCMEINYFAVVAISQAFLPLLKRCPNSRIINLSSLAGFFGGCMLGPYSASKHAVEGFAKSLRNELKPWNIHVSNVNPGFMTTPILSAAEAWGQRVFDEAPSAVKDQYDRDEIFAEGNSMIKFKENPSLVVNALVSAVTDAAPPLWYCPGLASGAMRHASVASPILDIIALITKPPTPTPEALKKARS